MQTKMIAKHVEMSYICPKCNFKLTTSGKVYDNAEFTYKIIYKSKKKDNICSMCKKGVLELMSVRCTVEPITNENYYEIKWECEKCNTTWYSIEDLNPRKADFTSKFDRIREHKLCINEECKSSKVRVISLMYHRKV